MESLSLASLTEILQCYLQVDDGVRPTSLHGVELQVSLEVASVESGDGKPVAEPCLQPQNTHVLASVTRGLAVLFSVFQVQMCHCSYQRGSVFVREGGSGSCGVQVAEEALDLPQGDAAASVAHLETEGQHEARVQSTTSGNQPNVQYLENDT